LKIITGLLLTFAAAAAISLAQEPAPYRNVGTMSQLMISVLYPTSNAIFYIDRTPPQNQLDWDQLAASALTLAESANLLMLPGRARDNDKWMKDAQLLANAGAAAYKAAKAKDLPAILALNEELNTACVECHQDYRPNYHKRK